MIGGMDMHYQTEQESFWAGDFGDAYTDRNDGERLLFAKQFGFAKSLSHATNIHSVLELGCNKGLNLRALSTLIPGLTMEAVEINAKAAEECGQIPNVTVHNQSIFDYTIKENAFDLTFTSGVLIHIAPDKLPLVYEILYKCSKRYIYIAEYYNPTPVEVIYRGNTGKLFKRDFAGEIMDTYPDLKLIDYGFGYHRDNYFPTDDANWFLMEKR